jgi:hypothetical protein
MFKMRSISIRAAARAAGVEATPLLKNCIAERSKFAAENERKRWVVELLI